MTPLGNTVSDCRFRTLLSLFRPIPMNVPLYIPSYTLSVSYSLDYIESEMVSYCYTYHGPGK